MKKIKSMFHRAMQSKHRKLFMVLAAMVVFATTYALILPAITLDETTAEQQTGIELVENQQSQDSGQAQTEPASEPAAEPVVPETSELTTVAPPVVATTTTETEVVTAEEKSADAEEAQVNQKQEKAPTETPALMEEPTQLTHQGSDFQLVVDLDGTAKLPQGVELKVQEISQQDGVYQHFFEKAQEKLGEGKLTYARFLDISFIHEGKAVEPAAPVRVSLHYQKALALSGESQMMAVHFDDQAQAELLAVEAVAASSSKISEVSFLAADFSVYGLLGVSQSQTQIQSRSIPIGDREYYKVTFVYKDNNNTQQLVTEKLVEVLPGATVGTLPENPFKEGFRFVGWQKQGTTETVNENTVLTDDVVIEAVFDEISIYTVTANYYYYNYQLAADVTFETEIFQIEEADTPFGITPPASTKVTQEEDNTLPADAIYYPQQAILEVPSGQLEAMDTADGVDDNKITFNLKYVAYTAEFDYVYMLKDLDGNGYSQIQTVHAYGVLGSTVSPQVLSFVYATFEKTEAVEITQASGQQLYVYYTRNSYSLTYNSNGGTYIPQQTGLYGSTTQVSSTVPTRTGYDFAGWYDNPELTGSPVTGNVLLDKDKTLYAKWIGKTVNYTVVYLREVYDNATGNTHFDYDSSIVRTGTVGSTVEANSVPGISPGAGYEVDAAMNANSSVEIAADGSSVLKVYYKLKRYTFIFKLNRSDGRILMNGVEYSGSNYQISNVVLGQDVSSLWPCDASEVYTTGGNYDFESWDHPVHTYHYKSRRFEVTADMIEGANATNQIELVGRWSRSMVLRYVEYWLQSAENPSQYVKSDRYSQSFYMDSNTNFQAKTIKGFDTLSYTPTGYNGTSGATYRFYYNRHKHQIDYYYGSQKLKTLTDVYFDAHLNTPVYNYTPSRPSGMDADFTWGGWMADSTLVTPYSFGMMPDHNLVLYAKWIAPTFQVSFDNNGGDSPTLATQTVEKYKLVNYPGNPTRENYDFLGWYTAPTGGQRYDWMKPVTQDMVLYAQWKLKPLTYKVRYLEEGTNNPLSAEKIETSPAFVFGQEVTEKALAIVGYRPYERQQTFNLDVNNKVITFYYTKKDPKIKYSVRYVLASNEAIEVAPTVEREVDGSTISAREMAVAVDKAHMQTQAGVTPDMLAIDYHALSDVESIVLSASSANNIITFKYAGYDTAQITVNYLDMDGQPIPGQPATTILQKKPSVFFATPLTINGYHYHHSTDSLGGENTLFYHIEGSQFQNLVVNLYYKKELTVTATNKSKVYDGTALTSSGIGDLMPTYQSSLEAGDSLTAIAFEGSQTNVGTSAVTPKAAVIKDANQQNRNYYYQLKYEAASLTVTKRPLVVTITGENKEKVYDGQAETVTYAIQFTDETGRYQESDCQFTGQAADQTITKTDAGIYPLVLQNKFINTNENFEVQFVIVDGNLTINPRQITLASASAEKAYDGTALTKQEVKVVEGDPATTGFVAGESFIYTVTGSRTEPGSSYNTYTYTMGPNTKAQNYQVTQNLGVLKVLPTINLQKTNQSWQALDGGQFKLTKWDGSHWAAIPGLSTLTVTSTGGVSAPGLDAGLYRIDELAAPDGYIVLGVPVFFKITAESVRSGELSIYQVAITDEAGNPTTNPVARLLGAQADYSHRIQIANEPGVPLPQTGGPGTGFFILGGLALMLTSIIAAWFYWHRRERREQA